MDILNLLETRKAALLSAGKNVRKQISLLIDEDSFVELDRYSFSRNEFYGEDAQGEGVVTGYATLNENAVYIVAQNAEVLNGGLSLASCRKMVKCLDKALVAGAPVIYLLSSLGIQADEGIKAMEGVGELLNKAQQLNGVVPQFSIVLGDVFGSSSLIAAICDYNFMLKDSCVSYASPLVIAAKSKKTADKAKLCGAAAGAENGLTTFAVKDIADARNKILNILDILPNFGGYSLETADDANRAAIGLNSDANAKSIIEAVFDKDYFVELGKGFSDEVVTAIGRIGGYSSAAIIFDGKDGVELNDKNVSKIKSFIYYAVDNELPLVTFVNTLGIEQNIETSNSMVLKNISGLINALSVANDIARVNVVYKNAIGLGYTLFASKSFGADYNFAFANAKISPFTTEVGAQIECGADAKNIDKIKEKYASEQADAINAAKCGFVDNIIEPQYVRQYVISALQMLL